MILYLGILFSSAAHDPVSPDLILCVAAPHDPLLAAKISGSPVKSQSRFKTLLEKKLVFIN